MKYLLILALFLTPYTIHAGQNVYRSNDCRDNGGDTPAPVVEIKHENHPSKTPIVSPTSVTQPAPTPIPPTQPMVPESYNSPAQPASQGNGQVYCSSPTAPGWVVGVKNGGCDIPINKPVEVVHLNQMPYTGLTFWEWILQLI